MYFQQINPLLKLDESISMFSNQRALTIRLYKERFQVSTESKTIAVRPFYK